MRCEHCHLREGRPRFCSPQCVGASKRRRVAWRCADCGAERVTIPSRVAERCKRCTAIALGARLTPAVLEARRRGARKAQAANRARYLARLRARLKGCTSVYDAWKMGFEQGYREGYTKAQQTQKTRRLLSASDVCAHRGAA